MTTISGPLASLSPPRPAPAGLAIATLVILLAAGPAAAVEIEPETLYVGGTRLEAPELGVAFTMPDGWQGGWPEGSEVVILRPEGDPSANILAMGEAATRKELAQVMAGPVPLGNGLVLQLSGPVETRGRALAANYSVAGGGALEAYAEGLAGPHGVAVAYVLIAPPGELPRHRPALEALVDSTDFGAPDDGSASGAASGEAGSGGAGTQRGPEGGDPGGDRWDVYLRGKHIVRLYTTSGYTEEQHIWLCGNGTFFRSFGSGGFGGGASGAVASDETGRWTATGAGGSGQLLLRYADGSRAAHDLSWEYRKNELYVDGKRWLHDENNVCD